MGTFTLCQAQRERDRDGATLRAMTTAATTRPDGRADDELRPFSFQRDFTEMADGSVLVSFGNTRVLCTASIDEDVPRWMRGSGKGWVTAEYSMLPGASPERINREAAKGKQSGRTVEIQRLIGRSLRAACDMEALGERQVIVTVTSCRPMEGRARRASAAASWRSTMHSSESCSAVICRRTRCIRSVLRSASAWLAGSRFSTCRMSKTQLPRST